MYLIYNREAIIQAHTSERIFIQKSKFIHADKYPVQTSKPTHSQT